MATALIFACLAWPSAGPGDHQRIPRGQRQGLEGLPMATTFGLDRASQRRRRHNRPDWLGAERRCQGLGQVDVSRSMKIEAGGFLLVFASGAKPGQAGRGTARSVSNSARAVSTSASCKPDGQTVAHHFVMKYPKQRDDVSYGVPAGWKPRCHASVGLGDHRAGLFPAPDAGRAQRSKPWPARWPSSPSTSPTVFTRSRSS